MNASDASAAERLASTLKVTLESSLHNGQYVLLGLSAHVRTCVLTAETQEAWRILLVRCAYMRSHPTSSPEYERLQILAMEEDLNKALFTIRYIKNTYAPINKLPPELLASIATSVDDPFEGTDLQSLCAAVCSYWRNSLLAFPGIWSTINTENPSRTKLYLARSKKSPLHVKYGLMTPLGVFERHIIPEHDRLQSLSIPLSIGFPRAVSDSLVRPSKSLKTLDVWMTCTEFSVPTDTMRAISRFAPNITVLKLHIVTTKLSSLEFPALTKLTLCIVASDHPNPTVEDLVKFLEHSPLLETLDLRLPNHLVVSQSVGTFGLERLKSAVFGGHSSHENNYICITGLQHLILPKQPITVDVQTEVRTRPWDTSPLLSAIRLGDATFPRQSITEGVIHIKDSPNGFFGHVGICGEHDNRIGLNYIQPPDVREGLLWRFRSWFNPMGLAPLRGIQTLTLGFFEFASDKEQCIGVLRAFLRELDQVRVLKVYMMDVSLLVRILQPSGGVVLLPSLDELQLHSYNPPELNRCVAHEEVHPGPSKKTRHLRASTNLRGFKDMSEELQQAFFGNKPIRGSDMLMCHARFQLLENNYRVASNLSSDSTLERTLRDIAGMGDIPWQRYRFQERAGLLLKGWSWRLGGYAEDSGCDMDANSNLLHETLRARNVCIGGIGGISRVVVVTGSGSSTTVPVLYL